MEIEYTKTKQNNENRSVSKKTIHHKHYFESSLNFNIITIPEKVIWHTNNSMWIKTSSMPNHFTTLDTKTTRVCMRMFDKTMRKSLKSHFPLDINRIWIEFCDLSLFIHCICFLSVSLQCARQIFFRSRFSLRRWLSSLMREMCQVM